ncbi:DDT domain-containing protein DDR4 [Linum grandiflorum]
MSRDQPISPSRTPNDAGDGNGQVAVKPQPSEPTSVYRSNRPSRACTLRAAAKIKQAVANNDRNHKPKKDHRRQKQQQRRRRQEEADEDEVDEDGGEDESPPHEEKCGGSSSSSKIVTSLVAPPEPAQLSRWNLRSMWELASVLNFLHVFRPFLNIQVEFSAEEFETALLTPNYTLGSIHMPLLKAIPPITRTALTQDTWITVLCRKLRDWWHWVADGDLPIVASHGLEIEEYKSLDPGVRVVILKALCDIRVEQEDIRNYIDSSIKQGAQLSLFRKERIGGDSQGISYWYEPDEVVGFRLYREIRKTEVQAKGKAKGSKVLPSTVYQWETVATNYDEFVDVSEKLFASENRTEASLGKKLKNDKLPEIEKVHKRKERLLKKQHREALLLDNFLNVDGLVAGRSLRDRKHVTYTFDDYDRSINEAIKVTKNKPPSPQHVPRREGMARREATSNGGISGPSYTANDGAFSAMSPMSSDYEFNDSDHKPDDLDRGSNRRRQRPQRYSERDYVEAISDNEANSEDDIVGEAVYDEEYLRKRKQRKVSSGSEGDEEYKWDGENGEEEEEEEEDEDSLSVSEESDQPRKSRKLPGRTRRDTKLISAADKFRSGSGLRRSRRSTRNRIDYKQYELSDSETDAGKQQEKLDASENHSGASENENSSAGSQDYDENGNGNDSDAEDDNDDDNEQDPKVDEADEGYSNDDDDDEQVAKVDHADQGNAKTEVKEETKPPEKSSSPGQDDIKKPRFLDLNELAPGSGFEDGPSTLLKDEDRDDF